MQKAAALIIFKWIQIEVDYAIIIMSILGIKHNASIIGRFSEKIRVLPHVHMHKGVKQLSVSLSVCQSGEKFLNLKIDRAKGFPKTDSSIDIDIVKKVTYV